MFINKILACCIVKNENSNHILEWIEYHLKIGIDHIILYDNGELNSVYNLINNSKFKNFVSVINWHKPIQSQNTAYSHCLQSNKDASWIAFIDIDEFIYLNNIPIQDFLLEYMNYGGICLNWQIYTANNHIHKPKCKVLEAYTETLSHTKNHVIKSIVQPSKTISFTKNPHLFNFINNYCVDIKFNKIFRPDGNIVYDNFYIKHFVTKSFEDWLDKLDRGRANYSSEFKQRTDLFWSYNPNMLHLKEDIYEMYKDRIMKFNNNPNHKYIV